MTVDILMATYDGGGHLAEQLDSIARQSYTDWHLMVRDDGSTDNTAAILKAFQMQYPDRVRRIEDEDGNLGPSTCFSRLLERVDGDYVMCCDQDDVWLPDKIAMTLAAMQSLESRLGSDTPLLVFSDARVVAADLSPVADSFLRHHGIRPRPDYRFRLGRLLMQNPVPGCTMMINRSLRRLVVPIPQEAIMHDWWCALVAALMGNLQMVIPATMLYRQHGRNVMGSQPGGWREWRRRIAHGDDVDLLLRRQERQAAALIARLGDRLTARQLRCLRAFAGLGDAGFFRRRSHRVRFGFWYGNFLHNAVRLALG